MFLKPALSANLIALNTCFELCLRPIKLKILSSNVCEPMLILLIPIPIGLKDGGTVVYDAILYKVEKVHTINPDMNSEQEFLEGLRIYFLSFEIFDNVK